MHICIVGCGQLSRMLALAGLPLGLKFSFIAECEEDTVCVEGLGAIVRWQPEQSAGDLYQALGKPDCVTIEKEQVDVGLLDDLQAHCDVHPNPEAAALCQHRHLEKQLLDRLAIPNAPYVHAQPAREAMRSLTLPLVVKSCREGYDGKNQWVLKNEPAVEAFDRQQVGDEFIMEQWIPFDREVSLIAARSKRGDIHYYPMTENQHHDGILTRSIAPAAGVSEELQKQAQGFICRIMEAVDYVGVLAMECFVAGDQLLVNELAPRVHNSGHWTQTGSVTSQFENHLRAIAGAPLGSTECDGMAGMVNLIGGSRPPLASLSDRSTLHWYNKAIRPGRKLGHVNFVDDSRALLLQRMQNFQAHVEPV